MVTHRTTKEVVKKVHEGNIQLWDECKFKSTAQWDLPHFIQCRNLVSVWSCVTEDPIL